MIMGIGMFGGLIYLPIYLQAVKGMSATHSGLSILPLVAGMFYDLDRRRSDHGAHRPLQMDAGHRCAHRRMRAVRLLEAPVDTPYYVVALIMYAFGMGLGFTMQVVVTAVQNSVDRRNMGVATASVTFFRSMGAAIGTALLGAILNIRLKHHLTEIVGAAQGPGPRRRDQDQRRDGDPNLARTDQELGAGGVHALHGRRVLGRGALHGGRVCASSLTMREKPLRERGPHSDSATASASPDSELVSMSN